MGFKVEAPYGPAGDQPRAIEALAQGVAHGMAAQVLRGATGTGKTYTLAKVIERAQRPTLVIAPNKTLAAQLAAEFRAFFPGSYVGYFVSYYDYYQPEAYIPQTDTYIAKDAAINEEIDELRHSATCTLFERRDAIIVASVSCIYGLGSPESYSSMVLSLHKGGHADRRGILARLAGIRYARNDVALERGKFRARGDTIEVFPAGSRSRAIRIELFGDVVERIVEFDAATGKVAGEKLHCMVFPASHYVTGEPEMLRALAGIKAELADQLGRLQDAGKLLEAQRLAQRTRYDLEMMAELGYCSGIENYSRHLAGRAAGEPPCTLIDYFPKDFLLVVDESHVTVPQLRAMYGGDQSRKATLVANGFRLPSALDNRPLSFAELEARVGQVIFVSATPGEYELSRAQQVVEQINRPTGLLDPAVEVRPIAGQVDDLIGEIRRRAAAGERALVTTLTKRLAENLTDYLAEAGIRARYLHADIGTLERAELVRDLRRGEFDALVGINLLREGLDMPEVSLVAVLDADKEGFLRSETSLVQTMGRAARNLHGTVIMYAERVTESMARAIAETRRRREAQERFNAEHRITPRTIVKPVSDLIEPSLLAAD